MKIYILVDNDIIHSVYGSEVDAKLKIADLVLEDPKVDFEGLRIIEKELERYNKDNLTHRSLNDIMRQA